MAATEIQLAIRVLLSLTHLIRIRVAPTSSLKRLNSCAILGGR